MERAWKIEPGGTLSGARLIWGHTLFHTNEGMVTNKFTFGRCPAHPEATSTIAAITLIAVQEAREYEDAGFQGLIIHPASPELPLACPTSLKRNRGSRSFGN